jgi:hypothetical protein
VSARTQQRKKWWAGKGIVFAVGVVVWLVADSLFQYRSILGLCVLAYLGLVWFLAPGFESLVKRLSLEAVSETLAVADPESSISTLPRSVRELREELRTKLERPHFSPYSVSISFNDRNLQELLEKVGFIDGKQWINGVKVSEEKPRKFAHEFHFTVLSSDRFGNPKLVYRTDGDTPHFLEGLGELTCAIEGITFELERSHEILAAFTHHPSLCFGKLLRDSDAHSTYELAVEVDEGWWDRISHKPDVECHKEYKSAPDWPSKSVYLLLARIPRCAIHAEDPEKWTEESSNQRKAQLEELGWTDREHDLGLEHKFFCVVRHDLDGESHVGHAIEFGSDETPERA